MPSGVFVDCGRAAAEGTRSDPMRSRCESLTARCHGQVLVQRVAVAGGFAGRGLGLMGRARLPPGEGLLLRPCGDVHTFFMRFPLDLVFLDADDAVIRVVRNARPWRVVFGGRGARAVLEVASGWMPADAVAPGDRVSWSVQP